MPPQHVLFPDLHQFATNQFFQIPIHAKFAGTINSIRPMERVMPYANGESPEVGDYVKNKWEQPGTVTAVHAVQGGHELISIRWDERAVDLPSISAAEFTLLSRRAKSAMRE